MAALNASPRPLPPAALVQQLVEFATLYRSAAGTMEFNLCLVREALGGLRIQVSAFGNRRVGLTIKNGRGQPSAIGEEEVAGLVAALRKRDVEVVDVVMG